ncbi:hypothetical protein H1R20_g12002, partial [Candolleomyces eurysporus]
MTRFATTLASQLASASSSMRRYIKTAVDAEPSLLASGPSLKVQLDRLVYKPFQKAAWLPIATRWRFTTVPFVIVIDGLDECEDKEGVEDFIVSMLEYFEKNPTTPLRFFITTRVEQHIQSRLKADEVHLEDLATHGSRNDIILFLRNSFGLAAKRDPVIEAYVQQHGDWPNQADTDTLVDHIDGSFIFASGLSKYILGPTNDNLTPMQRLPLTLNMNPGLDGLYSQTLARSQHLPHFFDIVAAIALVEAPLPISSLAELLGLKNYEVIHVLVDLQAIIQVPGTDEEKPITLCHTSLRDFLKTENSKSRLVERVKEANLSGLDYAAKYGYIHWARYWEEQTDDFSLEDVRQEAGGLQHDSELFLALGFVRSLGGMPILRPSIRENMILNWPKCLASAVELHPSVFIDHSLTKIPVVGPLHEVRTLELPIDTHGTVFSLSAHMFEALSSNVELAARSIQATIGPYKSLSFPHIITWEHGEEDTNSIVLAPRVPWGILSPLHIFENAALELVEINANHFVLVNLLKAATLGRLT